MARPWFLLQTKCCKYYSDGQKPRSVSLPGVVELLLLLGNPAVNLLLHLSQLELGAEHLVLLSLKGALSLLKSGLELFLLSLREEMEIEKCFEKTK